LIQRPLAQETWIHLWANKVQIRSETLRSRLLKIARQIISRQSTDHAELRVPVALANSVPHKALDPFESLSQAELREVLTSSIQHLEPGERVAFVLREVEGLSGQETAAALDMPIDAIRTLLLRGRANLQSSLVSRLGPLTRLRSVSDSKSPLTPADKAVIETAVDFQKWLNEISAAKWNLFQLSPRQFEELIAEIWDRFGYHIELTKRTRDGGRDIIAVRQAEAEMKLLIECKRYASDNKVGVSLVRSLYGVKIHDGATKAILATTSTFTKDASEFVTSHRWELEGRDFDGVVDWVKRARCMTRQSKSGLWVPAWVDLTNSAT